MGRRCVLEPHYILSGTEGEAAEKYRELATVSGWGPATDRLLSTRYLRGGIGDGGGCHPRDNIAMSHLARKLNLSPDLFESIMTARERQTNWIASIALESSAASGLPIVVLGRAFKPEVNSSVGSPSLLLLNLLESEGARVSIYDPVIDGEDEVPAGPAVYVLRTRHEIFKDWDFERGSIVIDPWRYVDAADGVVLRSLGCGRRLENQPMDRAPSTVADG